MFKAAILYYLSRAWSWIRAYWYVPLILILAVIIFILSRGKSTSVKDVFSTINKRRDLEREDIRRIDTVYERRLESINNDAQKEKVAITEKAKKDLEKLNTDAHSDLDDLDNSEKIHNELKDLLK